MAEALQDACRDLMQTEQHDAEGRNHDGRAGARRIVDERRDWRREHEDDDKGREADKVRDAHRSRCLIVDALHVAQGPRLRDGRHDAHGHRSRDDAREIDERHRHASQVTEELRRLIDAVARDLETLRHNHEVEVRDDRQHDARRRDWQRQHEDAAHDLEDGLVLRARQGLYVVAVVALDIAVELPVVVDEHDEARDRADECAERSAGRSVLESPGQEELREEDHRDDAEDLLHNLRDGRRRHALPALQIAARSREEGHEEYRRREHDHREVRARIADEMPLDEPVRCEIRQDGE